MIYFTSDLHFYHDREFLYKPRGFNSVYEMNDYIVKYWNIIVSPEDDVYILGDLMLNDNTNGAALIASLHGKLHIIRGNHDTDTRIEIYKTLPNVVEVVDACYLKYQKYHFFCTHYPCLTGNLEKESLHQMTLNLFGHTHSKEKFYNDMPYMYNVSCDANKCMPISIVDIIARMHDKVEECEKML